MKTFLAVFLGILAAVAVVAGIFGVVSIRRGQEVEFQARRLRPVSNMRGIATACIVYQSIYGQYPEKLSQLGFAQGQGPSGSREHGGLVSEELAAGKEDGYLYLYAPTKWDRKNRVTAYTVTATRKKDHWGGHGHNLFVDETGVIRQTWEERPATPADPPLL